MFSRIAFRGGGDGRYDTSVEGLEDEGVLESEAAKQRVGTDNEMTDPKKATLAIQRRDNRGSNEMLADDQYLSYV